MELAIIQPKQPSTKAFVYSIPFEIKDAKNSEFWFKGYYYNHKQIKTNFEFPVKLELEWI